jgi:hypothetical protein
MKIFDNVTEIVRDDMEKTIRRNSKVSVAAACFSMAPLHSRVPRDVVFFVAFQHRIYDIHEVDAMLRDNDLPPFLT